MIGSHEKCVGSITKLEQKSKKSKKQHKPWQFQRTRVIDASLQKCFVCHPSRYRSRFVTACDVCARSHMRTLLTSFGSFRAFRCLQRQKQHKPKGFTTHAYLFKRLALPRLPHTSPFSPDLMRVTHAHPLNPAALAFVPFGIVLVRVRVLRGSALFT